MFSVLPSSVVRVPLGVKPKTIKLVFAAIFAEDTALKSTSKECLVCNHHNVSKWSVISTHGLLFQWARTIKIQLYVLIWYKVDININSWKFNFSQ